MLLLCLAVSQIESLYSKDTSTCAQQNLAASVAHTLTHLTSSACIGAHMFAAQMLSILVAVLRNLSGLKQSMAICLVMNLILGFSHCIEPEGAISATLQSVLLMKH